MVVVSPGEGWRKRLTSTVFQMLDDDVFYPAALIIPISNCTFECFFTALCHLPTWVRSTMGHNLAIMLIEKGNLDAISPWQRYWQIHSIGTKSVQPCVAATKIDPHNKIGGQKLDREGEKEWSDSRWEGEQRGNGRTSELRQGMCNMLVTWEVRCAVEYLSLAHSFYMHAVICTMHTMHSSEEWRVQVQRTYVMIGWYDETAKGNGESETEPGRKPVI